MYSKPFLLLLAVLPHLDAQSAESFYFPEDDEAYISNDNLAKIPSNVNLTQIRGSPLYEKYVDQIISGGISKLTLAINKILLQTMGTNRDNVVFAPVSIAGALALVLLGSNGKTFEEISSIMGMATDVDIETKSLQVHEQLGRMIRKLEATSGFDMGQQVNFAAAIFVQNNYPIRSVYKNAAMNLYESEILNVDFQTNPVKAQEIVNDWVSERTRGKIRDILGETPTPLTKVIIASAMYFKASWEKPFFEGATTRRPFYVDGRKSPTNIEAEMMANGGDFPYFRDQNLNCEVMGFPYKGNATFMYVVMPFNSNAQKLKELEERLTPLDLQNLADHTVYTRAVLLFPKMKIQSTIELNSVLQLLGIRSLFIPSEANLALLSPGEGSMQKLPPKTASFESSPLSVIENEDIIIFSRSGLKVNCSDTSYPSANITACLDAIKMKKQQQRMKHGQTGTKTKTRITNRMNLDPSTETIDNLRHLINQQSTDNHYQNPGLYADKVVHKVYMDITETGTEAAASTSVSLSRDGGRVTFRVDVPFFFFIRHEETKTILFWGSVTMPTPNFKRDQ